MLSHLHESIKLNSELQEDFETVLNDTSDNEELNPGAKKDIQFKEKHKLLNEEYEN